jgi:hypothetical protein
MMRVSSTSTRPGLGVGERHSVPAETEKSASTGGGTSLSSSGTRGYGEVGKPGIAGIPGISGRSGISETTRRSRTMPPLPESGSSTGERRWISVSIPWLLKSLLSSLLESPPPRTGTKLIRSLTVYGSVAERTTPSKPSSILAIGSSWASTVIGKSWTKTGSVSSVVATCTLGLATSDFFPSPKISMGMLLPALTVMVPPPRPREAC